MKEEYEPLTEEERAEAKTEANSSPTFEQLKRIVNCADAIFSAQWCAYKDRAMTVPFTEDDLNSAIEELQKAIEECPSTSAMMVLKADADLTSAATLREVMEDEGSV